MASLNHKTPAPVEHTHGGAITRAVDAEEQLCRAVMTCLLWEDAHYEDGQSIADRIKALIPQVDPLRVAQIAIDARGLMKLRHVPLLVAREMARLETHRHLVSRLLPEIIQRPDELTEFLAIYWAKGKEKLSSQSKEGLAKAFRKFNEYSLAKYNKDGNVKLRDVLFLCHARPQDMEQARLWKKLIGGYCDQCWKRIPAEGLEIKAKDRCRHQSPTEAKLATPDTWEVELSAKAGEGKKDSWERLLSEGKLGGLALIRNLRNFVQAGVDRAKVRAAFAATKFDKVLPFRFLAAATHAKEFEPELEVAMLKSVVGRPKLPGRTVFVVDVSGSMYGTKVSEKSEMTRAHAACALAVLARELCEDPVIYATAGNDGTMIHKTALVPARRGFALSDEIYRMTSPLGGGGIFLKQVCDYIRERETNVDRVIVVTDEADCDRSRGGAPALAVAFGTHNYIVNVNVYQHGIAYKGKWVHINGWSEAILDFIRFNEEGFKPGNVSQALIGEPPAQSAPKTKSVAKPRATARKAKNAKTAGSKKGRGRARVNVQRN